MKRFTFLALVTAALLMPTFARAEGTTFTYRPELRQWVPVPAPVSAAAVSLTAEARLAKHEAMAHGQRNTRMLQGAAHCDRMMQQAREEQQKHEQQHQH
jgi:hypothetical protein